MRRLVLPLLLLPLLVLPACGGSNRAVAMDARRQARNNSITIQRLQERIARLERELAALKK
ncbi:MAG: hypothetical protein QNJ98_09940 [Planctomycetota bacterium]|nr:hypothetical protein [Planctomycetota bacterium]